MLWRSPIRSRPHRSLLPQFPYIHFALNKAYLQGISLLVIQERETFHSPILSCSTFSASEVDVFIQGRTVPVKTRWKYTAGWEPQGNWFQVLSQLSAPHNRALGAGGHPTTSLPPPWGPSESGVFWVISKLASKTIKFIAFTGAHHTYLISWQLVLNILAHFACPRLPGKQYSFQFRPS